MAMQIAKLDVQGQIQATFTSIVKALRVPVPLLLAVSIALLVGAQTVEVQGFSLPRLYAALATVVTLLAVSLAIFKSAGTLEHLHESLRGDDVERKRTQFYLRTEGSIFNPFSHTYGALMDYSGLATLQIPMIIVLLLTFMISGEELRNMEIMIQTIAIIQNPDAYSPEQVAAAADAHITAAVSSLAVILFWGGGVQS